MTLATMDFLLNSLGYVHVQSSSLSSFNGIEHLNSLPCKQIFPIKANVELKEFVELCFI